MVQPLTEQTLRCIIRSIYAGKDTNVLFDIMFEEHKFIFPNDQPATRYYHLRTHLDESAKRKDLYYGKHPAIDNRAD